MGILLSFMPWFLFWLFVFYKKFELASLLGLAAIIVVIARDRKNGRCLKYLQAGTLVFFVLLAVAVPVLGRQIISKYVNIAGNSAILLIVFFSILLRRPFSIQFVREQVPQSIWHDPHFIHNNYVISWFWFFILLFNFMLTFLKHYALLNIPSWLNVSLHIFNCVAGIKLTHWYLRRQKRHSVAAG